ncbi:MAG: mechanosensitive ion channel [Lachnospiraceae bacterium]|nr:mechanosensitive ion channel [Lachnospiraceae bacterium]
MYLLAEESLETQIAQQVDELSNLTIEDVKPSVLMETLQGYIPGIIDFGINILICIIIFFIGKKIISLIRKIIRRSLQRSSADKGVEQFIDSLLRVLLYLVLVMIIAGKLGIQTTSIVTLVGSAGVAIGLALQGSLSNFAGGVLILILQPFKIGDFIVDGSFEGTVMQIQIFYTKLLTNDNKVIMIPNGTLMNSNIVNVTGQEERRVDISVGISYDANILEAKKCLEQLIVREESVLKDKPIDIFVDNLADSAVMLGIHVWVPTKEYWAVKWHLTENIKLSFDEAGISIPYNQLSVHIEQG